MERMALLLILLAGSSTLSVAAAAEYYVDFEHGKDTHSGTRAAKPFQHAPTDPAAQERAAAVSLQPGDVVRLKGGVHYRGALVIKASGQADKPIVFDGNTQGTFGKGRAIIDGSDILSGWQRCTSAEDCRGNPQWKEIYWTQGPAETKPMGWNLAEDGQLMFLAETPNPASPFLVTPKAYAKVPKSKASTASIMDPRLAEMGGAGLVGGYIGVYCKPNWIYFTRITGFDPDMNLLTFAKHKKIRTFYKEVSYAVLNSVLAMDRPGEYCVDEETGRVYVWPYNKGEIAKKCITMSRRRVGVDIQGAQYVTVQGFRIQQFACGLGGHDGTAIKASGDCQHLVIRDNELTMNRSMSKSGVLHITKATHCVVEKNRIFHNPFYRVMILDGYNDSVVRENILDTNSGTGIICFRTHRTLITGNVIRHHTAVHSQGMAIYAKCGEVTVDGNRVEDGLAVTVQDSLEIVIRNNIFDAKGHGTVIGLWNGGKATVTITNNVLTGCATEGWARGLAIYSNNGNKGTRFIVKNNVVDGIGGNMPGEIANNLFTQPSKFEKYKGNGNALEADLKKIFLDPDKGDYRLREEIRDRCEFPVGIDAACRAP